MIDKNSQGITMNDESNLSNFRSEAVESIEAAIKSLARIKVLLADMEKLENNYKGYGKQKYTKKVNSFKEKFDCLDEELKIPANPSDAGDPVLNYELSNLTKCELIKKIDDYNKLGANCSTLLDEMQSTYDKYNSVHGGE